ncbi:T6SS immunity protein Tdi1 domain-containing protein [Cellulophaga baltica]|uniref:T6SS immunity protein Tdi1 domain-containing protein n=1 Tax=Cellulophaga baltica TaxID=76594 RepID=UPI0003FF09E0|nr:T6SS immunity protein Tdi1 domain-containing protein [Cellulophaga baltica]
MFKVFFAKYPNFKIEQKVHEKLISDFKGKLPDELLKFWAEFGFGVYMDEFLKIINPNEYQDSLNESYINPNNTEIVFAITAFGDYLVWTGDAIRLIKFRYGSYNIIENDDDMTWFFDMDLADDAYASDIFKIQIYKETFSLLGSLAFDECYGYVPILAAGGAEKVENVEKVKIIEHLSIITQFTGKID